jgi:DNA topoisomerase-1
LAIPPAWTDVWICAEPHAHLQATGRDARGRKQYRYHARWRALCEDAKYSRMLEFSAVLPRLRATVRRHLALEGLGRERVLAAVVRLLDRTLIRIGNSEYARDNGSYGLTTMRDQHVRISGHTITFAFKGKSGRRHVIHFTDRALARIVRGCRSLPGQELFQYIDREGVQRDVTSADVNQYLTEIGGETVTAKDFRTWAGTILAAKALRDVGHEAAVRKARQKVNQALEQVAELLGNTRAVCRKSYVHPAVLDSYFNGAIWRVQKTSARRHGSSGTFAADEALVVSLLQRSVRRRRSGRPPIGKAA